MPDPEVIATSFPLSPPTPVDKFIAGKRQVHNTDLLSQPGLASWGSQLMLNNIVDGSCCHASLFQELSFPAASLGRSSQPPLVTMLLDIPALVTRVRLPGDRDEGRRQQ